MATMVGLHGDLKSVLRQLIELDYDAAAAYQAAIDRLKDADAKSAMSGFKQDHERHIHELGAQLRAMGVEPPTGPNAKRIVTEGKVVIAGLIGDRAILLAMKTNEDDTNTAYERAASRSDLTPELRLLLAHNLDDEKRHRTWLVQRERSLSEAAHP